MARGMDVDCVGAVVNYDAPVYPKVFVHRAGRTARAGRSGAVYTLLRPQDMRHFKAMASKLALPAAAAGSGAGGGGGGAAAAAAQSAAGRELRIPPEELKPLRPMLSAALHQVQELLASEQSQDGAGGGGGGRQQQPRQAPSRPGSQGGGGGQRTAVAAAVAAEDQLDHRGAAGENSEDGAVAAGGRGGEEDKAARVETVAVGGLSRIHPSELAEHEHRTKKRRKQT